MLTTIDNFARRHNLLTRRDLLAIAEHCRPRRNADGKTTRSRYADAFVWRPGREPLINELVMRQLLAEKPKVNS